MSDEELKVIEKDNVNSRVQYIFIYIWHKVCEYQITGGSLTLFSPNFEPVLVGEKN